MPSVEKPAIFECAANWGVLLCAECQGRVDVRWLPRGNDPLVAWPNAELFEKRCSECILRATSPRNWLKVDELFRHMRAIQHNVGLAGESEVSRLTRQALGLRAELPTLTGFRGQPAKRSARHHPYLQEFTITGELPLPIGRPYDRDDFSPYPSFRLFDQTQTGLKYWRVEMHLGIDVIHPKAWPAIITLRWNPWRPSEEYVMTTLGWSRISAAKRLLLHDQGLHLLEELHFGGRPQRSNLRNEDYYIREYRQLSRALRRDARQGEFIEHLRDLDDAEGRTRLNRTTLKRNLQGYELWPFEKLALRAKRPDNRR
jgi:hypothetical protein